jgi:hypothetical protein
MVYAGISAIIYVMGELIDLATTYLLSPDLALETNVLVRWFDFGWTHIVLAAFLASIIMSLVQFWMWRRLSTQLPDDQMTYKSLYRRLIVGDSAGSSANRFKSYAPGALMGIAFVVAYAAIASKLLTCVWNLLLLTASVDTESFLIVIGVKNVLAAMFGLVMFYVIPFLLNRKRN